jgi:hypothetical protein
VLVRIDDLSIIIADVGVGRLQGGTNVILILNPGRYFENTRLSANSIPINRASHGFCQEWIELEVRSNRKWNFLDLSHCKSVGSKNLDVTRAVYLHLKLVWIHRGPWFAITVWSSATHFEEFTFPRVVVQSHLHEITAVA